MASSAAAQSSPCSPASLPGMDAIEAAVRRGECRAAATPMATAGFSASRFDLRAQSQMVAAQAPGAAWSRVSP